MAYATIELKGHFRESANMVVGVAGYETGRTFRLDHMTERVDTILRKSAIRSVVVHRHESFECGSLAGIEAIRRLLLKLRAAERDLIYFATSYSFDDVYLASACTRRVIHSLGSLSFLGKAVNRLYFGKLLSKYNIDVDVLRRGLYKSAATPFTEDGMDQYDRDQIERVLHVMVSRARTLAGSDMIISDSAFDELMSGEILGASAAVERGWIHRTADFESILTELRERKEKPRKVRSPKGKIGRSGRHVALFTFEGAIAHGQNRRSPLLGQVIGSDWFLEYLREVRDDRRIQALVLRISSPGGSATASEDIRAELMRIREKKPVIVSMGSVAASGGYWIATAADRVFSQKFTITGSIGVISMLIHLGDFLRKRGVTSSVVKEGDHADLGSTLRKMTIQERRSVELEIDRIYLQFLSVVAESRSMSVEAVREIAEGRIWSGEDAFHHGLVDEVGDLHQALDYTAMRLGVSSIQLKYGPRIKRPLAARLLSEAKVASSPSLFPAGYQPFVRAHSCGLPTLSPFIPELSEDIRAIHGKAWAIAPEILPLFCSYST